MSRLGTARDTKGRTAPARPESGCRSPALRSAQGGTRTRRQRPWNGPGTVAPRAFDEADSWRPRAGPVSHRSERSCRTRRRFRPRFLGVEAACCRTSDRKDSRDDVAATRRHRCTLEHTEAGMSPANCHLLSIEVFVSRRCQFEVNRGLGSLAIMDTRSPTRRSTEGAKKR